jgi:hypothetical protein
MENEKDKTPENNNLHDSNEDVNCDENTNINNGQEKKNTGYNPRRSYSCRINEPKNKDFSNNDEIKLNLNKKFLILKTPQIKPKKGLLNPVPMNLGSISCTKTKSKYNLLNEKMGVINDIISEGENEESNELSLDSSSVYSENEEDIKETSDNNSLLSDKEENNTNIDNKLSLKKYKSQLTKTGKNVNTIDEENDDYDVDGKISLKNIKKTMIISKKIFLKNNKDYFDIIDKLYFSQYQKLKEKILIGEENEENERKFHKTTGFGQIHRKYNPILEYLKTNSKSEIKNN